MLQRCRDQKIRVCGKDFLWLNKNVDYFKIKNPQIWRFTISLKNAA